MDDDELNDNSSLLFDDVLHKATLLLYEQHPLLANIQNEEATTTRNEDATQEQSMVEDDSAIQKGGGRPERKLYRIKKESTKKCVKYMCESTTYEISFFDMTDRTFAEVNQQIQLLFEQLSRDFIEQLGDNDRIRIVFYHDILDSPISTNFTSRQDMLTLNLLDQFQRVMQSYKNQPIEPNHNFKANIIIARIPSGGGRKHNAAINAIHNPRNDMQELCQTTSSIKVINNNDDLCLLRAVLVGKAYADKEPYRNRLLHHNNRCLNKRTLQLARDIQINDQKCGIKELRAIEIVLKWYQITLFNSDGKFDAEPLYQGPMNEKFIYITLTEDHYNVITSMPVFYNRCYFCDYCKIGYNQVGDHLCTNMCNLCKRLNCKRLDEYAATGEFECK